MQRYCKLINEETGEVQLGVGCSDKFYQAIGMTKENVEQSEVDGLWYLSKKCPSFTKAEKLENAKNEKLVENDLLRDEKLNSGILYNDILFDSDIDQKINILATLSTMADEDTITWYGMNNDGLLCTKQDLLAIGNAIKELHIYCWNKNARLKDAINSARTINSLNKIEVNYNDI